MKKLGESEINNAGRINTQTKKTHTRVDDIWLQPTWYNKFDMMIKTIGRRQAMPRKKITRENPFSWQQRGVLSAVITIDYVKALLSWWRVSYRGSSTRITLLARCLSSPVTRGLGILWSGEATMCPRKEMVCKKNMFCGKISMCGLT